MHQVKTPKTLSGIKSYARSIKELAGITHQQALDQSAREAGYHNWAHAFGVLGGSDNAPTHWCQICTIWRDWLGKRTAGWEILWIPLARPLLELIRAERCLSADYIGGYRLEGENHLVDRTGSVVSQSSAQWHAQRAARTLRFMQATGLRPSRSRRTPGHPHSRSHSAIPGSDHFTAWYDPLAQAHIGVDEPYGDRLSSERLGWASAYGFQMLDPDWVGMHNPGERGTQPTLIAPRDYELERLGRKLEDLGRESSRWRSWSDPCKFW